MEFHRSTHSSNPRLDLICSKRKTEQKIRRMEPITDHMRHVSLNHRGAEAALAGVPTDARTAAVAGGSSGSLQAGAPSAKTSVGRATELTTADAQVRTYDVAMDASRYAVVGME